MEKIPLLVVSGKTNGEAYWAQGVACADAWTED